MVGGSKFLKENNTFQNCYVRSDVVIGLTIKWSTAWSRRRAGSTSSGRPSTRVWWTLYITTRKHLCTTRYGFLICNVRYNELLTMKIHLCIRYAGTGYLIYTVRYNLFLTMKRHHLCTWCTEYLICTVRCNEHYEKTLMYNVRTGYLLYIVRNNELLTMKRRLCTRGILYALYDTMNFVLCTEYEKTSIKKVLVIKCVINSVGPYSTPLRCMYIIARWHLCATRYYII